MSEDLYSRLFSETLNDSQRANAEDQAARQPAASDVTTAASSSAFSSFQQSVDSGFESDRHSASADPSALERETRRSADVNGPNSTLAKEAVPESDDPWADVEIRDEQTLKPKTVAVPVCPTTVGETGLRVQYIAELVLKHLHLQRNLQGVEIARLVRLPFQVIEESLRFLKEEQCLEVVSGDMIGPASYRFTLTERGRQRAKSAIEHCRYVGPAPVPLSQYVEQCRRQSVSEVHCTRQALSEAFSRVVLRPSLLDELGPAVCSGRSIFLYGPPGNGKTLIAKGLGQFLNTRGGDIYVPYAIETEGGIITVFDPTVHHVTDEETKSDTAARELTESASTDDQLAGSQQAFAPQTTTAPWDPRWRRIRRPVVITGGELTLQMLDLRYHTESNFYTAPMHIKANGGVFLIDDFGRQIVSPRDLLNRWILPLEDRVDFLTLATGKKFSVPFEQLIIFSTNLEPRELVDEAFLRRIRHKIRIGPPTRDHFRRIFEFCCNSRGISFEAAAVDYLYANFYDRGKPPRSSDPRDLLEIAQSICRFRGEDVVLSHALLAEATDRFFCQV